MIDSAALRGWVGSLPPRLQLASIRTMSRVELGSELGVEDSVRGIGTRHGPARARGDAEDARDREPRHGRPASQPVSHRIRLAPEPIFARRSPR